MAAVIKSAAAKEKARNYRTKWRAEARSTRPDFYLRDLLADRKYIAKKKSIPFSITVSDITLPTHCPVLGLPLFMNKGTGGGPGDNSPTIDRIIPEKGYVPGNVIVISNRANRIKNNSTPEELRRVADFFEKLDHANRNVVNHSALCSHEAEHGCGCKVD